MGEYADMAVDACLDDCEDADAEDGVDEAQARRLFGGIMKKKVTVKSLVALGFDQSFRDQGCVYVRCSRCDAAVIMGMACHEHGCPNQIRSTMK